MQLNMQQMINKKHIIYIIFDFDISVLDSSPFKSELIEEGSTL